MEYIPSSYCISKNSEEFRWKFIRNYCKYERNLINVPGQFVRKKKNSSANLRYSQFERMYGISATTICLLGRTALQKETQSRQQIDGL